MCRYAGPSDGEKRGSRAMERIAGPSDGEKRGSRARCRARNRRYGNWAFESGIGAGCEQKELVRNMT